MGAALLLTAGACGSGESSESFPMEEPGSAVQQESPTPENREIIRNADISLRVDDVRQSVIEAGIIADSVDGRTSNQSVTLQGEAVYANLTLRVPAESLDGVLLRLGQLGEVQSLNVNAEDVTSQAIDLDARIQALQTSVARLEALLAQATSARDLVEIEGELSARQAELDSLVAQRAALSEAVALSTVYVSLSPTSEAAEFTPPGFLSGLESGWNALRTFMAATVTALGFILPFLVLILIIAVPIVAVVVILSRVRRRQR